MIAFDYVKVARNPALDPGCPKSMAERRQPRFMKYMALRNEAMGSGSWGADYLNTVIASNGGDVPSEWLDAALAAEAALRSGR
jgi:7,8-dihydro-6-hydroxymethylpterin-pyrophosphokinase